jgi:hypothetical protein
MMQVFFKKIFLKNKTWDIKSMENPEKKISRITQVVLKI